ncbi:hypothetical protein IU450_30005 [Nocardia abscessus]|uniref:hypothetical protein n=1 Tax=Nocardia abscessus TaxID=120957 RepID=UPI001895EBD0|nr:hypothetical protein [Nocardia abscessus]MBF6340091.1 hypothetical protein [Nocardia abscessus]
MDALGVVDLDSTSDLDEARRVVRRIATGLGLDLTDVMTFRSAESGWIFRLLTAVHLLGAHAVIVRELAELHGLELAVTGVADLHTQWMTRRYVGYGPGHTRPSRAHLAGA